MIIRLLAGAVLAAALATPAMAQSSVRPAPSIALDSAVYVERLGKDNLRSLEPADRMTRGDRVVTVVKWYRTRGDGGFTVTNPLPHAIAYQASAREDEEVSVDGGHSWGRIGSLKIGSRLATPEDVTHVRWRVPAERAAHGRGLIAYSGIVR